MSSSLFHRRSGGRRGLRVILLAALAVLSTLVMVTAAGAAVVPVPVSATLVSADPADQTPNARNGEARAFAEIGDTVYVGGTFTEARNASATTWGSRPYLFAYHRDTGALSTTFLPVLDGAVNTLAVSPTGLLIVGGVFKNVNGVARRNLVALNPTTGATDAGWAGRSDGGTVRDMVVHGNWLYVSGAFNWINGVAHSGLARLNATTGAVDAAFQIDTTVGRHDTSFYAWTVDVSPDGATLAVGGNFTLVNGASRNQIALVDLTGTPSLIDWSTEKYVAPCVSSTFTSYVQDISFSADGDYFVVGSNGGKGWPAAYCDALVRFETDARGANQVGTWVNFTGNDTITSVEIDGGVIYLGGHFRWLNNPNASDAAGAGAIDRLGVGAVSPATGMPVNWNPRRSPGSATLPSGAVAWGSTVPVLWRGAYGLYFGQNSDGMGGEYHGRLGVFPAAGGRTVTPKNPPTAGSGYLYLGTAAGQLTKVAFTGTALGTATVSSQPNLTGAGAIWRVADRVYWGRTLSGTPTGTRLDISMFNGTTVGAPWEASGYNDWFNAMSMSGAFFLDGRLYYTRSNSTALHYRYFEIDGNYLGATEFTLPTQGVNWSTVRGMAWVASRLVYGSTDGRLRGVPFDPTATVAVDGASSTVLAQPSGSLTWSTPTMFFAAE